MPVAYLHIGQPKTGTTSFQRFIKDKRDWLASQGLFVPLTGLSDGGAHHKLMFSIAQTVDERHIIELRKKFTSEIKKKKHPDLLISSEAMTRFFHSNEIEEKITSFFSDLGYSIVPIVVFRDIVPLRVSSYNQLTKTLQNHLSFEEFFPPVKKKSSAERKTPGKRSLIEYLENRTSVVIPYNVETRKQGIVTAILTQLGIVNSFPSEARLNKSVSDAHIYAARWLGKYIDRNDAKFSPIHRQELNRRLAKLVEEQFGERPAYNPLTERGAKQVMDRHDMDELNSFAQSQWGESWEHVFANEPAISLETNDWFEKPDLLPSKDELDKLHQSILDVWQQVEAGK